MLVAKYQQQQNNPTAIDQAFDMTSSDNKLASLRKAMHSAAQAVDEPAAMEMVLKKIADLTGSASAYIFAPYRYAEAADALANMQEAGNTTYDYGMQFQFGMPDTFFDDYQQHVWKLDPWSEQFPKHMPKILAQGGFIGEDLVSASQMQRSEFYADYLKPALGMRKMMSTMLSNGYVLSMMRSESGKAFELDTLAFTGQFKFELDLLAHASARAAAMRATLDQALKLSRSHADRKQIALKALNLTPAEIEIAMALAHSPPKQVARDLGIAVSTVRTHLANIFAKTGTHRQSELIWLLSNLDRSTSR